MTTEKVAVVTGAGSGLGRLITIALADQGWFVVAAGRRPETLADTVGLALPEMVLPVVADVGDPDSAAALFGVVRDRFGRLDLLVNNAGTGAPGGSVDEVTPEGWQSIVATNLTGSFLCAHHAVAMMKEQRPMGGRIINNGSIANTAMTERIAAGVPQADGSVMAEPTFDPKLAADAVVFMAGLPLDANVQFLTITATTMPFIGRG
jgi:NAD(P)-dependent dehydrogenase (short-subunit alcohol dehydrogenase family)